MIAKEAASLESFYAKPRDFLHSKQILPLSYLRRSARCNASADEHECCYIPHAHA